jgi:transposase
MPIPVARVLSLRKFIRLLSLSKYGCLSSSPFKFSGQRIEQEGTQTIIRNGFHNYNPFQGNFERLRTSVLRQAQQPPKEGKKKGGIKAHTIIRLEDNMPCFVRYTEAVRHDHVLLSEVSLPKGSILVFDKGYVDYAQYERFTNDKIFYVTRLKDNALYECGQEYDIPETADSGILKDEEIILSYGEKGEKKHRCRRIAYWDSGSTRLTNHQNKRIFVFISNSFELSAEQIALIYKKRWQIELLFKQLKQNFPLKYFLGDNQNAIEIQIWMAMLANLLISLVRSKVKRSWAFSNLVSVIRQQLMNYINVYAFLEDPEGCWKRIIEKYKDKYENSLFPKITGAYF